MNAVTIRNLPTSYHLKPSWCGQSSIWVCLKMGKWAIAMVYPANDNNFNGTMMENQLKIMEKDGQ